QLREHAVVVVVAPPHLAIVGPDPRRAAIREVREVALAARVPEARGEAPRRPSERHAPRTANLSCPERTAPDGCRPLRWPVVHAPDEVHGAADGLSAERDRDVAAKHLDAVEPFEGLRREIDEPREAAAQRHTFEEDLDLLRRATADLHGVELAEPPQRSHTHTRHALEHATEGVGRRGPLVRSDRHDAGEAGVLRVGLRLRLAGRRGRWLDADAYGARPPVPSGRL